MHARRTLVGGEFLELFVSGALVSEKSLIEKFPGNDGVAPQIDS